MGLKKHWLYLKYLVAHKWYVFVECYRLGIPLAGITHDWSKVLPDEWFPYVEFFYGDKPPEQQEEGYSHIAGQNRAFDFAWLLHQKRNKHHWQFWLLPEDDGGTKKLDMPDRYRREMLADWFGAGKAQGRGDQPRECREWYLKNRERMQLHPRTRSWVEEQLGVIDQ
jgi:hypothetical protein